MIPDSIWNGEVRANTAAEAEDLWCRIVARGRIVERTSDRAPARVRLHLVLVEHPELPAGEVYALFFMGYGIPKVYRTTPDDARTALQDPSAFNLG